MTGDVRAVVAAAIIADGRVLCARRTGPPPVAGRWEFPGGKVEPGETPAAAIVRECREELGVTVRALRALGAAVDARIRLELWHARLDTGIPQPLADHDRLRWLAPDTLTDVCWLPMDAELLPLVRPLLG